MLDMQKTHNVCSWCLERIFTGLYKSRKAPNRSKTPDLTLELCATCMDRNYGKTDDIQKVDA